MSIYIKTYIIIVFITVMFFTSNSGMSQSIHFSQAYSSHLTLNPANTGRYNGDWRVVMMHRMQGNNISDDYNTSYISVEHPIYFKEEKFDIGAYYSRDNSAGSTLPTDKINIAFANSIMLNRKTRIHAGVQIAYILKQINWNGVTLPDQYNRDTGGFDPSLPTSESFENSSTSYPDMGFGLLYVTQISKGIINGGYSLQQINRPKESFFNEDYTLPLKHVIHAKADIDLSPSVFTIPTFIYVQTGESKISLTGINIGYNLNEWMGSYNNFLAGLHIRNIADVNSQSLIFSAGGTWQSWSFMLSYDANISGLSTSNFMSSGLELGVTFKRPSTGITRKTIPCERY
jgi:type IX secretion system PorP/SprF family membrane protein